MSKPAVDLFPGSAGDLAFRGDAEAVIAERTAGLDLSPHPITMTQLTPKQRREIKQRIANRTATREDFKRLEWDRRFGNRRRRGVNRFYVEERERLLRGEKGTRNWTEEQRLAIINKKRPRFDGKTMEVHHTYSASQFPHLADKAAVMYPATRKEHLYGWHGGSYKTSKPGKRIRYLTQV